MGHNWVAIADLDYKHSNSQTQDPRSLLFCQTEVIPIRNTRYIGKQARQFRKLDAARLS
ncbi:MAG: hypothetical protein RMY28_003855 [Nostoc sp. ChiSLP01]|nr:hypothetical protein [Nostoc sp. CmiSLP01]MDZ8286313.1 hypothetical protein [Nostoc sp. ChiSLP01]